MSRTYLHFVTQLFLPRARTSAAVLVAGVLAACSSTETTASQASAVLGGTTDDQDTGVVAIFIDKSTDFPEGLFCSGVLVAPNLVMTARHCVGGLTGALSPKCEDSGSYPATRPKAPAPANTFEVVNTTDAYGSDKPTKVKRVFVPPDPDGTTLCGHDVAMLELEQPLAGAVHEPSLDGPPAEGATFSAVGYGYNADGAGDGTRRRLDGSKIVHLGERRVNGALLNVANDWLADVGPCGGDSGSPALDASGKIIGIMSRGPATVCTEMTYTRVDVFADWIRESTREASSDASLPVPAWAAASATTDAGADGATPPPAAPGSSGCAVSGPARDTSGGWAALLALGLVLGVGQRRRRRA